MVIDIAIEMNLEMPCKEICQERYRNCKKCYLNVDNIYMFLQGICRNICYLFCTEDQQVEKSKLEEEISNKKATLLRL